MQLRLDNIRQEFDGKVAVDNLSMEVPEGVIYGLADFQSIPGRHSHVR